MRFSSRAFQKYDREQSQKDDTEFCNIQCGAGMITKEQHNELDSRTCANGNVVLCSHLSASFTLC